MSEQLPDASSPKILRLRGVLKRLLGGSSAEATPKASIDAEDAERQKHLDSLVRSRCDAAPAGPGLKEYDVKLELFNFTTDMTSLTSKVSPFFDTFQEVLKRHREAHPENQPDGVAVDEDPFVALMYSGSALSGPSVEVAEWLKKNSPQNGYFTPEMVTEAVVNNPAVVVQQQTENGLGSWLFSDNNNSFALTRTLDGSHPATHTQPYLAAKYRPEYDFSTEEVVWTPELSATDLASRKELRSQLGVTLMQSLGVVPIRMQQELDFRVIDSKPVPYFTDATTSSLESVRAQQHIIADFPPVA